MIIQLNKRQLATVLAAARYWQREGLMSSGMEQDIATNGGTLTALDAAELDKFCEDLNTGGLIPDFSVCANYYGKKQAREEPHLTAYADAVQTSDEVETDDFPIVSAGADDGAFVMCWVWVSDTEAGIEKSEEEEEDETDD